MMGQCVFLLYRIKHFYFRAIDCQESTNEERSGLHTYVSRDSLCVQILCRVSIVFLHTYANIQHDFMYLYIYIHKYKT